MKIQKKSLLMAGMLALTVLFSCKKKSDDPTGGTEGKKAKITISLSSEFKKAESDKFDVTVVGANATGTTIDWLVDGVTKKGSAITVGTDDFNGGKTIVIESASSFYAGNLSFGGFEFGATPFTVNYKIEVNGKIIDQGTERIVKDRDPLFIKQYQL